VDQLGADAASGFSDSTCAKLLNRLEGIAAGFVQNADAVHDKVGSVDGTVDGVAVAQVCLNEGDLADIAERLQEAGEIRAANGDADAIAALCEFTDDVPADEAGPSEHGNEWRQVGKGHDRLLERLGCVVDLVSS